MISIARLKDDLVGHRVAFDEHGESVDVEIPEIAGEAILLVSPVTDAVKKVAEGTVRSLDRDEMWAVQAIVLNEGVLRQLDDREMSAEDLLSAVRVLGVTWQVSPTSDP